MLLEHYFLLKQQKKSQIIMDDWMDGGWNYIKTIYDLKFIEVSQDQSVTVDFVKCVNLLVLQKQVCKWYLYYPVP